MTARLVMTQEQIRLHPDEWLKRKAATIGGSEVAVLLGVAPGGRTPFTLYVEKLTGQSVDEATNQAEKTRGLVMEPIVADELAEMRPDLVVLPGGMYADEHCPWMTASFDRFTASKADGLAAALADTRTLSSPEVMGLLTPAELKTAISRRNQFGQLEWGDEYTDDIPVQYQCQALWQMAVWGCDEVLVPVHFMDSWKSVLYVVRRTEEAQSDIEWMVQQASAFLDRIDREDPPELDWRPESGKALRFLHPLEADTTYRAAKRDADRLRAAYKRMKAAEQRYGLLQNQIAAKAGGAAKIVVTDPERPGKDVTVMGRRAYPLPVIDQEKLRREHPAIAKQVEKTVPVDAWWPGQRYMKLGGGQRPAAIEPAAADDGIPE